MASETPININITKDMGCQEKNQYNEFKDYIIKNNIILQEENKNSIETITSLREKIETYEEAEDKYDNNLKFDIEEDNYTDFIVNKLIKINK